MKTQYDASFHNANDLLECLKRGCEVEFEYLTKTYSITHIENSQLVICEFYNEESEMIYETPEDLFDYIIEDKILKNIVSDLKIISRSF